MSETVEFALETPEPIRAVINKYADKYLDDPKEAAEKAEREIRALPEFEELAPQLVSRAILCLIYNRRHVTKTRAKTLAGGFGGPAKVNQLRSKVLHRIYKSVYDDCIGGKRLGSYTANELPGLMEMADGQIRGWEENKRLYQWLYDHCPASKRDQPIEKVVSKKLADQARLDIIRELSGMAHSEAGD